MAQPLEEYNKENYLDSSSKKFVPISSASRKPLAPRNVITPLRSQTMSAFKAPLSSAKLTTPVVCISSFHALRLTF